MNFCHFYGSVFLMCAESSFHANTEGQLSFTGLSCQAMQVICPNFHRITTGTFFLSSLVKMQHRRVSGSFKAFSGCKYVGGSLQVLQVATAFRSLHNLQRVFEADHVIVPPYLNSIRQKPHAQLLVQFLFSRNGGLIPFLAHSPINMEGVESLVRLSLP